METLLYLNEGNATGDYPKHLDEKVKLIRSGEKKHEYMVIMIREMEIREEGKGEGIIEINALNNWLIIENRLDDLLRATTTPTYQANLLHELSLLKSH